MSLICLVVHNSKIFTIWHLTEKKKIADLCRRTKGRDIRHLKVGNIFNKSANSV